MKAILKREFLSYFHSPTGYAIVALYVFVIGIFASANNFWGYPDFSYTLYNASFIYMILIPVLTMKCFSEEKKQKTDRLLYSLPVGSAKISAAKYFAMLGVLGAGAVITGLIPLALSLYGEVDLAEAYVGLFAFWLLGAALCAIGMFISTLTDNQIVCAAATFFVTLVSYFLTNITSLIPAGPAATLTVIIIAFLIACAILYILTKSAAASVLTFIAGLAAVLAAYFLVPDILTGAVRHIAKNMGLFDRYNSFAVGICDFQAMLYYVSVSVLFFVFTASSFEKRRWS